MGGGSGVVRWVVVLLLDGFCCCWMGLMGGDVGWSYIGSDVEE